MSPVLFRSSNRPTLGVELEFQLLDRHTFALRPGADQIVRDATACTNHAVKPEFHTCCVELSTPVCDDLAQVEAELADKIATLEHVAALNNRALGWGGTHPFSHWLDQTVFPAPRYRDLANQYRETLNRQLTFGFHVHVGMPSGDAAIAVLNRMAEYLPLLLALSSNSPFWCGRATGLHSHRLEIMSSLPTGGLPPQLGSWQEYTALVESLSESAVIGSPKELWWDARPNAEFGTLEVRICDMPLNLAATLAITALIQCLAVSLFEGGPPVPLDTSTCLIIRQNRWRAARFGMEAEFASLHHQGHAVLGRDAARDLWQRLRPTALQVGCARQFDYLCEMAAAPSGAERQLETYRKTRDLVAVARLMSGQPDGPDGKPKPAARPRSSTFPSASLANGSTLRMPYPIVFQ